MLVFGDQEHLAEPREIVRSIRDALARAWALRPGLDRHAALTHAFVEAGELVQGLVDREFDEAGWDVLSPSAEAGARVMHALAGALDRSWQSGLAAAPERPVDLDAELDALGAGEPIRVRRAEGFAIYALYPETYLAAARASGLGPETTVIGLRSIGVALGALVAAALGAGPAWSLRPVGHPFARELRVAPDLATRLLSGAPDKPFAIVDEGPGLSGSSFAAVDTWLQAQGVARSRIHFFPSHGGEPGPQAGEETIRRWRTAMRHQASFERVILEAELPVHRLETWVSDLLGELDEPLQDISGGGWRASWPGQGAVPPADGPMERRKYLARARGNTFLVKFAGLGPVGTAKLARARALAAAGFVPTPVGLCHGFLVEQWIDAPPLGEARFPRARLVESLGRYLAARATLLAPDNGGAALPQLLAMARHNAALALGERAADRLAARLAPAAALEAERRPVATDNRLHQWEWRVLPGGRLLKLDALDHCAAHDLVGCQDIAWDVAGAVVEFGLSPAEAEALQEAMGRAGVTTAPALTAALLRCYLAFQLGLWTMAAERADATEAPRLRALASRYGRGLTDWIET